MPEKSDSGQSSGPAIDRHGAPVIDPTVNVIALTQAANKRQDDLRESSDRYNEAVNTLREKFFTSETNHAKEIASLRADYTKQLAEAEAKRIDAIRAVDVNAVAVASERQAAAASVLANQVAQSADALRTLVATTATATAEQNRQQLLQITDRLSVVEKSQYEGRGKSQYTDPVMQQMLEEMRTMRNVQNTNSGKTVGQDKTVSYIALGISIFLGFIAIFQFLSKTGITP